MKLYIKQKFLSVGDKFSIIDENKQVKYYAEGKIFSLAKKLHIYNQDMQEISLIKQEIFTYTPVFVIHRGEKQIAEIVKDITFLKDKYEISGLNWEVDGKIFSHDYAIKDNKGKEIVKIHKKWISLVNNYEIEINDIIDEVNAISVILAINCVLASRHSILGSSN